MQKNCVTIGLSLDDFWNGNPLLYYLYLEAYKDRIEFDAIKEDRTSWQLGQYSLQALRHIFGEAGLIKGNTKQLSYPKEPFTQTAERERKLANADLTTQFMHFMDNWGKKK